jgi:lipid-binding SYLF domain-containing protein
MKLFGKLTAIGVLLGAMSVAIYAKDSEDKTSEEVKRINSAANVLDEIMAAPDKGIPRDVFEDAKCVAVVPSMI